MKPYRLYFWFLVLGCITVAGSSLSQAAAAPVPTRSDNDPATRKGFDYFYNLEYDKSVREFEATQQVHPDDPFAVNHVLSSVIFRELYRIGALDTEAYAADSFLTKKHPEPLDPKVHDRVKQLSDQALALSQAQLDKDPNNVDALYARGITRGLRATYMGMGEKAWFAALRSAVSARRDHERVLELGSKIRGRQASGGHRPLHHWQSQLAGQGGRVGGGHQR